MNELDKLNITNYVIINWWYVSIPVEIFLKAKITDHFYKFINNKISNTYHRLPYLVENVSLYKGIKDKFIKELI